MKKIVRNKVSSLEVPAKENTFYVRHKSAFLDHEHPLRSPNPRKRNIFFKRLVYAELIKRYAAHKGWTIHATVVFMSNPGPATQPGKGWFDRMDFDYEENRLDTFIDWDVWTQLRQGLGYDFEAASPKRLRQTLLDWIKEADVPDWWDIERGKSIYNVSEIASFNRGDWGRHANLISKHSIRDKLREDSSYMQYFCNQLLQ